MLRRLVMMGDTIKEQRFEQLCDCNPPKGNDENEEQEPPNFQGGNRKSQYCVTIDVLDLVDINFAYTCIAELVHMMGSDTNFARFMIGIC